MVTTRARGTTRRRLVLAGLVVTTITLAACGSNGSTSSSDADAGGATGSGDVVEMRLIAYKPATLEVRTGTTVTWKQQDAGFHTVTSGTASEDASGSVETQPDGRFDSGQLAEGDEFQHTFSEPGTFQYFCEVHPATMSGRVVVE